MRKYILATALIVLSSIVFTSCKNQNTSATNAGTTENSNNKTIVVACSNTAEPYSFVDNGEHKGFEVDLWNEIGKRTGYDVKMETMGFSSIFGAVDSGKVDCASNYFGKSKERLDKYDATISYGIDEVSCAVLQENSEVKSADDLKGKKVAVAEGSWGQAIANEVSSQYSFEVVVFGDGTSGVQDLSLKRVDAWLDSHITLAFDSEKAGVKINIIPPAFESTEVGAFFRKNDPDSKKKLEDVNKAIKEMLDDGTIKQISEKWFFTDVTENLK